MNPGRMLTQIANSCLILCLLGASIGIVWAAKETKEKVYGELNDESALMYFVRTHHFTGAGRTTFLYADDSFLGVLDDNSYTFAYLSPGKHLLWTNWTRITKEVEVVPGRAYYLDTWGKIQILSESDGKALIEKVKKYASPSEKEIATSEKHLRNRLAKAQKREGAKDQVEIAEVSRAVQADTTDKLSVPAFSEIKLELLEHVTSFHDSPGDVVWFRVAEDASIDSQVYLSEGKLVQGTVRLVDKAKGGGVEAGLDIVVPSVEANDGTMIPLMGQVTSSGKRKFGKSVGAGVALGIFGVFAVKGGEAYVMAGQQFVLNTREDVWLSVDEAVSLGRLDSDRESNNILKTGAVEAVMFSLNRRKLLKEIRIPILTDLEITQVAATVVGDLKLPEAIECNVSQDSDDGPVCTFEGWSLVRYMQLVAEQGTVPVGLRGTYGDGTVFAARAEIPLSLER